MFESAELGRRVDKAVYAREVPVLREALLNIRRVTQALDARMYEVVPVAAPSDEEKARPYLWRFWRHIPRRGRVVIFDRSWYGRVLVERVEGLCRPADWMRAYSEINEFEHQFAGAGRYQCSARKRAVFLRWCACMRVTTLSSTVSASST